MPEPEPQSPVQVDVWQRTSMAAERTWLAWWRTALAATAGALAVGRFAPELLDVAPWPYVALGCGYAALAIGMLAFGARRQRELERSIVDGVHAPLSFHLVASFTVAAVLLVIFTVVIVAAQI
jgi:inner membrane protein YidH